MGMTFAPPGAGRGEQQRTGPGFEQPIDFGQGKVGFSSSGIKFHVSRRGTSNIAPDSPAHSAYIRKNQRRGRGIL